MDIPYNCATACSNDLKEPRSYDSLLTLEPHPKKLTLLASGVRLDPKAVMHFQSMNP